MKIRLVPAKERYDIRRQNRALLEGFFGSVIDHKNPKPLKVGILNDIMIEAEKLGLPFSKTFFRRALRLYTSTLRYQHILKKGGDRYDLQGNVCGVVTESEKKVAKEVISSIYSHKWKIARHKKVEKWKKWKKWKRKKAEAEKKKAEEQKQEQL
ncbi:hypothetical protein FHQ26_00500 [Testudinibacter sp. TR-2022]|uniref:ProQ/FINO family protein n=1 Tax=Testudinibacter sp. TR-2022 TaxID=2585029 RepID=UPI0011188181|nr:ProQ/FinO family protein [Testudinibacter sp. TR-2022]TNH04059.1 hypothetical protein FHQ22_05940 [Pasteurellaceae bacterium Phil31]TNH10156.1 hypothetical protein FHQ25_06035 [Testudinibacter sp. TR-2022]TNH13016.1 hypothetical protein FHQ26_00500 [Testudinibacter sp. TR-2022]